MGPLVIKDSETETTICHFGLMNEPGESLVGIQQQSQMVLFDRETWPQIKAAIDAHYDRGG